MATIFLSEKEKERMATNAWAELFANNSLYLKSDGTLGGKLARPE